MMPSALSATDLPLEGSRTVTAPMAGLISTSRTSELYPAIESSAATAPSPPPRPDENLTEQLRRLVASYSLALTAATGRLSDVWFLSDPLGPKAAVVIDVRREDAQAQVERLLHDVDADRLEDGSTAWLGERIFQLLTDQGGQNVRALLEHLLSGDIHPSAASHILRWIGRIHHRETFAERLHLLRLAIESPAPLIRDGAALGLGEMDSPRAVDSLRRAVAREERDGLRADMERLLRYLERPR